MTTSNLVLHAERELSLLGYPESPTSEAFDPEFSMRKNLIDLITLFSEQGHSGFSASYLTAVLPKLMRYEPLTPITDDPAEWQDQSELSGEPMWQNVRASESFSTDGGKTYYTLSEKRRFWYRIYLRLPFKLRSLVWNHKRLFFPFHTSKVSGR